MVVLERDLVVLANSQMVLVKVLVPLIYKGFTGVVLGLLLLRSGWMRSSMID